MFLHTIQFFFQIQSRYSQICGMKHDSKVETSKVHEAKPGEPTYI